ncbi:RAD51-associated protein 1 isoform X2 [Epinephelus fuscoguttatus]|uniref:RAD51-associated protein 1 isoform X2 n=1 Tax=Epinephelus fuscoguttatus TaxID=293821 RepID=UPI0020D09F6A|nr:RAD51-associated protein 1 isoform X2 [Epinephelus fuscoguttatus]
MDRPSRKTKVVSYSEANDFNDDEDFACVKAPPSKKPRESVKQEHKKSSSKSSSQESNSQSTLSQKNRKPLDVKLYERDLEAAITLSLLNNAGGIMDQPLISKGDVMVQVLADENTDPASVHLSNCSVDLTVLGLDEITSESPARSKERKAATKATEEQKKQFTDEDEDYKPKLTPDSESDEDFSEASESEDEEFTVRKVSKAKKLEKVTKNEKTKLPPASKKEKQPSKASKSKSQAAAPTPVRSPPTAKIAPKRPATSSTVPTSRPAVSVSPAGGRIPKWNPPAQVGKSSTSSGPAVKSPGQGLRLGLSRLVRVKPLHPSVASH